MASYTLNAPKMFSDIEDGVAIILNSETGIYYGLNGIATDIYGNLMNGASAEAILEALQAMPGAPDDMPTRLETFINALKNYEIIVESAAKPQKPSINADVAQADGFTLRVEKYEDAQELLLADPIHEVLEDMGWQPAKSILEKDKELVKAKEAKLR